MHQEVIENLESIHGALLRMNRSIQAEGTFGIMKNDRWYKRIVRRGINSVKLEVLLVAIGYNLYKYQNKKMRNRTAAQIQKENLYGVGEVRLFSVGFQQFMHNKSKKRDVKKLNRVFSHPLFLKKMVKTKYVKEIKKQFA